MLCSWDLAGALPDARLVVSELVTNALRHGLAAARATAPFAPRPPGPLIGLRLLRHPGELGCEVTDPSDIMPARLVADDSAEIGRGLCLITALSHQWGAYPLPGGGNASRPTSAVMTRPAPDLVPAPAGTARQPGGSCPGPFAAIS